MFVTTIITNPGSLYIQTLKHIMCFKVRYTTMRVWNHYHYCMRCEILRYDRTVDNDHHEWFHLASLSIVWLWGCTRTRITYISDLFLLWSSFLYTFHSFISFTYFLTTNVWHNYCAHAGVCTVVLSYVCIIAHILIEHIHDCMYVCMYICS